MLKCVTAEYSNSFVLLLSYCTTIRVLAAQLLCYHLRVLAAQRSATVLLSPCSCCSATVLLSVFLLLSYYYPCSCCSATVLPSPCSCCSALSYCTTISVFLLLSYCATISVFLLLSYVYCTIPSYCTTISASVLSAQLFTTCSLFLCAPAQLSYLFVFFAQLYYPWSTPSFVFCCSRSTTNFLSSCFTVPLLINNGVCQDKKRGKSTSTWGL